MTTIGQARVGVVDTAAPENLTILPAVLKRTVWGAVFAGAIAAVGIQMILTVLGVALGISGVDRTDSLESVGMMAGLWWLITGTMSLLLGGCVLGRTAGIQRSVDVLLHAFAMWALTAVFGFLMLWSTAGMASAAGAVSHTWGMGPMGDRASLGSETRRDNGRSDIASPDAAGGVAGTPPGTRDTAIGEGGRSLSEPLTPAEAEQARDVARSASWWTLGGLLLGVGAALVGGWFAAPQRMVVRPSSVSAP